MRANKSNLPKTLPFQGGRINQAGLGRAAGSINYVNHVTGQSLDLFEAQVVQVGPIFALAAIAGNDALAKVRVDQALLNGSGPAQLGDILIVGPLDFLPAGPRARAVWSVRTGSHHHAPPQPANRPQFVPPRNKGTVTRVAPVGTFGEITDERTGSQYFVHQSQLRGTMLRIGARVSFLPARTPRGLSAIEVQPAQ
jgi:cold shock CspA family protein